MVGRACRIESAAPGGPRFNSAMTPLQRRSIANGIWCCNVHADIIDGDLGTFSVLTLREWKRIAEIIAYDRIDSSHAIVERPHTLVQLSDAIVFEAVWCGMNVESCLMTFEILSFVYGDLGKIDRFIHNYNSFQETKRYVVIESSGYGRQLSEPPVLEDIEDRKVISLIVKERTDFGDPSRAADARLTFTDWGMDLDVSTNEGWITGKRAVIQSVQMLLGSYRGQWGIDPDFGSYLFLYYRDHHTDHDLLQRLIKLEISRMTFAPDASSLLSLEPSIPISTVKWVEGVTIRGHSSHLLGIDLHLYFTDNTYFSDRISVPASMQTNSGAT